MLKSPRRSSRRARVVPEIRALVFPGGSSAGAPAAAAGVAAGAPRYAFVPMLSSRISAEAARVSWRAAQSAAKERGYLCKLVPPHPFHQSHRPARRSSCSLLHPRSSFPAPVRPPLSTPRHAPGPPCHPRPAESPRSTPRAPRPSVPAIPVFYLWPPPSCLPRQQHLRVSLLPPPTPCTRRPRAHSTGARGGPWSCSWRPSPPALSARDGPAAQVPSRARPCRGSTAG